MTTPYEDFQATVPVCAPTATDPDTIELGDFARISNGDLTDGTIDGTVAGLGLFDLLMQAFKNHIEVEWNKSRLRGTEYSSVYLGGMQACLDAAIQFTVAKEKTNLENIILRKATYKAAWEVELIKAQVCKTKAEYDAIIANITKTLSEKILVDQKTITEKAQVDSTQFSDTSVIGAQVALYKQQTAGFLRDAEQKAAKIMVDYTSAAMIQGLTIDPSSANLSATSIGAVIAKMKSGIETT